MSANGRYVRKHAPGSWGSRRTGWVQINLSCTAEERELLDVLADRLGWTKRRVLVEALQAFEMAVRE